MTQKIDLNDVVTQVRALAAAEPEYRYLDTHDECVYVDEYGRGSCIIGKALMNIDIGLNHWFFVLCNTVKIKLMLENAGYDPSDTRVEWLSDVQSKQDTGATWAHAIRYADNAWSL